MVEPSESTAADAPPDDLSSISSEDLISKLPLRLIKSETIPPAPNRGGSAIDWLPDFSGYAWIAYGASSCLVISHFPSPLSPHEAQIGPIFRQVFELSTPVTAVAWSSAAPSAGDLAAASENCISLFSHDSTRSGSSFCWSQTTSLVQSTKVEAVTWTGSGDGIIAGGIEVVLWKNKDRSWEVAWKFRAEIPQTLVSSTWSIEGPSAMAAHVSNLHIQEPFSQISEAIKCVLVCHSDGNSKYLKAVLRHPQPVSLIQWRPSTGRCLKKDAKHSARQMLLTCCLDGVVRLWSESNDGKVRKTGKDVNDQKIGRLYFCVAAIIEINQVLNGFLGSDVFVTWVTDIQGIINTNVGADQIFSTEGYRLEKSGKCEWLIGLGPGMLLTFWAVHCIDDIFPTRFPRVTLWQQRELQGYEAVSHRAGNSDSVERSLLNKVVICRNQLFGPPILCSLIQVLPSNSLTWSLLYTQSSSDTENELLRESGSENSLSCRADEILNIDGHGGYIRQVVVHPCSYDDMLAASLDSNGTILFWSVSSSYGQVLGPPMLSPAWIYCGQLIPRDGCSKYTSLRWAPSVLGEESVLLMGHADGIDCIVVKVPQSKEEAIACHNLCTIPFYCEGPNRNDPADIFAIPLPSACNKTCDSLEFMLLGIWMKDFQALSWKIIVRSLDLLKNCDRCSYDSVDTANCRLLRYENSFSGNRYSVIVESCSLQLPYPHREDHVTSYAVVCPANLIPYAKKNCFLPDDLPSVYSAYHMATGSSDGRLKLWRNNPEKTSSPNLCWELVGVLAAHQGPISAISIANCGRKIATVCTEDQPNATSTLCIWDSLHVAASGSFMLEDSLRLDGDVVALDWLALGSGQLLLGVCLANELHIYAPRRRGGQTLLSSEKSSEIHIWYSIAVTYTLLPIRGFLWAPVATAVVVHDNYFSLFGKGSLLRHGKQLFKWHPICTEDRPHGCKSRTGGHVVCPIFFDGDIDEPKVLEMVDSASGSNPGPDGKVKMNKIQPPSSYFAEGVLLKNDLGANLVFWSMLEVAEKLCGSLPVYHPEALLMNICSGNWKRAYIAIQHLVEFLTSNNVSGKGYSTGKCGSMVPQIHLVSYLEELLSKNSTEGRCQWSANAASISSLQSIQFGFNSESDVPSHMSSLTESEVTGFAETLEKFYKLAAIANIEKMQILAIIDLVREISNPHSDSAYKTLDEPGQRFWVAVRFQQLYLHRRFGRLASMEDLVGHSELIGWAFHSDCQEILFGSIFPNEPSWQEMRTLGVGLWFTNASQLRARMEKLARSQYLKNKDPKASALLYVALNRLQVLAGLFKISKDEKDKPLVGFLSRNFQEEKNKAAALKNAYVLMGRHQLELAIAFFLLGGDTSSAITVCAKNLGDEQLALVICRLVEGYGGPLERHLISKFMLPSAIEKGDYWLASLLEWVLGNYSQSFMSMLAFQMGSDTNPSAFASNHAAFLDPSIGQYCLKLATTNNMRNAVGERNAAIMCRWSNLMAATSLYRCGLPLEALERFSSSPTVLESRDQGCKLNIGDSEIISRILEPNPSASSNWLSGDVALNLESDAKLDLAMQYLSRLIREHPSWQSNYTSSSSFSTSSKEPKIDQYKATLENFQYKLCRGLASFEQRFSLIPASLINLILVLLCNNGLLFIGCDILCRYTSQDQMEDISCDSSSDSYPIVPKLLLKAAEETSRLLSRFVVACSMSCSQPRETSIVTGSCGDIWLCWSSARDVYMQGPILLLWRLRSTLQTFAGSFTEDFMTKSFIALVLLEYLVDFAYAWLQRNLRCLALMVESLPITCSDGHTPYEADISNLSKLLQFVNSMLIADVGGGIRDPKWTQDEQGRNVMFSIPEDERWHIVRACLLQRMSCSLKHQLNLVFDNLEEGYSSKISLGSITPWSSSAACAAPDSHSMNDHIKLVSVMLAKTLETTIKHLSSHQFQQFASFLWQKVEDDLHVPTLTWLEESRQSQPRTLCNHPKQVGVNLDVTNSTTDFSAPEISWDIFADPKIVLDGFAQEKINWSEFIKQKPYKKWSDLYEGMMEDFDSEETNYMEGRFGGSSASNGAGLSSRGLFGNGFTFLTSGKKDAPLKSNVMSFHNPKEIYKRNGELLEALCVNSIDQRQVAVAGNQKGISFLNWDDSLPFRNHSDYLWSEADWPLDGWAGSESTPVPTCVSPGIGLGSKKGAHLALGGATIGVGSLARPGRDLTGGGEFGLPGYAGNGASGLGWEIQGDFEEFIDPPATVENISTRALSSHPSRPFFLVGSSNTHVYLWEFGKDTATATYGVLPAANIPPPYALASISSLQFDYFGHRFATAASNGTVCTWQLEVGGRSNIRPTESSLCFNSHASDVTYVTSSGSVIAVAGCSTNGVNVVIWDTLAPHTTSRASIVCHEGGTRSLAVFDNHIGSGSISPIIVTGGKGGDVGLHDFRYIATGRSKRHKRPDIGELNNHTTADTATGMLNKSGDLNSNGMLWYIPKAHLGSVTKISTIPNTSLFLTGSKDGDVKLWDAKRAKLVFHWTKLHERHTFLQPSSRGYGGVVRAAVTDIQVVSHGFLTCGGDGSLKLVRLKNDLQGT